MRGVSRDSSAWSCKCVKQLAPPLLKLVMKLVLLESEAMTMFDR